MTIRQKITAIAAILNHNKNATFQELCGKKASRLEIVVTFLALLELVKRYQVAARQEALFSEIQIEKMEGWNSDQEMEIEFE